jgi:hypothetical protein
MIFVKRDGVNSALASAEYKEIFPEGAFYQQSLFRGGKINKERAKAEILRKLKEDPGSKRARELLNQMNEAEMKK